jgi:hypothetical protein
MRKSKESIEGFKPKNEAKELKSIKEEIRTLIQKEEEFKKKKEPFDPRLLIINPDTLTDDDLAMFEKYKKDTWQLQDFLTYTDQVTEELKELEKGKKNGNKTKTLEISNSRDNFRDFIGEKANLKFPGEESAEEKEKDNY